MVYSSVTGCPPGAVRIRSLVIRNEPPHPHGPMTVCTSQYGVDQNVTVTDVALLSVSMRMS